MYNKKMLLNQIYLNEFRLEIILLENTSALLEIAILV